MHKKLRITHLKYPIEYSVALSLFVKRGKQLTCQIHKPNSIYTDYFSEKVDLL